METTKTFFLISFFSLLMVGCGKDSRNLGPGGIGAGTNPYPQSIVTEAELERDLDELHFAEMQLYDDDVVFEFFGRWEAVSYCCTDRYYQIESLNNYITQSSRILSKYGGPFQLIRYGQSTPVLTSLPAPTVSTFRGKQQAAQNELSNSSSGYGKATKSNSLKPSPPINEDIILQSNTTLKTE